MRKPLPWSHFTPVAGRPYFLGYCVESCEVCGQPTQASNAVNLHETRERLLSLGMTERPTLPPEEWHVEELGHTACEDCIAANGW